MAAPHACKDYADWRQQLECIDLMLPELEAGLAQDMVSNWLNEYVLVPLSLACAKRSLALGGLFWKQVVMSTGQPDISPPPLPA